MKTEDKNPKTFGVSYKYWYECILALCERFKIDLSSNKLDLEKYYHDDLSPKDVYYILRIRTVKTANLTVRWSDAYGREEVQFFNNEQIREFYKLNPSIKRVMQSSKRKWT